MRTLKCRGTLGDSYIVNCLIQELAMREPVLIKQCIAYLKPDKEGWEGPVAEIYSLVPNVEVKFVGMEEFDSAAVPRLRLNIEMAIEEDARHRISRITPYPVFEFPGTDRLDSTDYIAFSPRGGKADEHYRHMEEEEVRRITSWFPDETFVLVGHNPEFVGYEAPNVINLIGQTTILEAMGIVARAKKFIGIQGLMAYVALSQRLPSVVFTKSEANDKAFRCRLMDEWRRHCTIYKTWLAEDPGAFARFMKTDAK